jgi:hypothetical protein
LTGVPFGDTLYPRGKVMTRYQKIFKDIKETNDYKIVGEDIDYKIIIDDERREVILQFEESDSRQDWKHNLMFIPWILNLDGHKVLTTHGYACAYKSAKNIPLQEICIALNQHGGYDPVIRGWSFGSAMAKIAVRHFWYRRYTKVKEQDTYGDVKVWLNPFTHFLAKKWCCKIMEFVCINDFVTWQVPFYQRTNKKRVGGRFSFKRIFNTEYEHTHYEQFDYSEYEN